MAIRTRIALEAQQSVSIAFITGAAPTRAACLALIDKYRDPAVIAAVFGLAWVRSRQWLQQLELDAATAALYGRLADAIVYAGPALRADPAVVAQNRRDQSGLWGMSISGDWPIVLLQLGAGAQPEPVRQLLQAHAYWRAKGLTVDLVICNRAGVAGRPQLQDQVRSQVQALAAAGPLDQPGGVFVRLAAALAPQDQLLLQAVARVVLDDDSGTLAEQVARRCGTGNGAVPAVPTRQPQLPEPAPATAVAGEFAVF